MIRIVFFYIIEFNLFLIGEKMNHQEGLVKCLILNPTTNHSVAALQYFWRVLLLSLVTTCMVAATAVRAMLYLAHTCHSNRLREVV